MITPEQLGIDSTNIQRLEVINSIDDGLTVSILFKDGIHKIWHYKAVPTEEDHGQRFSPIKWVKVDGPC